MNAGFFEGNVLITGDLNLPNADCAEDFELAGMKNVEPGTVVVLNETGTLVSSTHAYDKRVVGVISGAGSYTPAIILDRQPDPQGNRQPLALVGKVFCKVDAGSGPIAVGDLLTTSGTSGHAMAVTNPSMAFGAVIGKALESLQNGRGLIQIIVALQ